MKKVLSLLFVLGMLLGMMPKATFAAGGMEANPWSGRSAVFVGDSIVAGSVDYKELGEEIGVDQEGDLFFSYQCQAGKHYRVSVEWSKSPVFSGSLSGWTLQTVQRTSSGAEGECIVRQAKKDTDDTASLSQFYQATFTATKDTEILLFSTVSIAEENTVTIWMEEIVMEEGLVFQGTLQHADNMPWVHVWSSAKLDKEKFYRFTVEYTQPPNYTDANEGKTAWKLHASDSLASIATDFLVYTNTASGNRGTQKISQVLRPSAAEYLCFFTQRTAGAGSVTIRVEEAYSSAGRVPYQVEDIAIAKKRMEFPGSAAYCGRAGCKENHPMQAFDIYDGVVFVTYDGGYVGTYDLQTGEFLSGFLMGCSVSHEHHCGNATFGNVKYDPQDRFPLLYSSGDLSTKACYVERIMTDEEGVPIASQLVQWIDFDLGDAAGANGAQAIVDVENGRILYQQRKNSSISDPNNAFVIGEFPIPLPGEGTLHQNGYRIVSYDTENLLMPVYTLPYFSVMYQGAEYYRNQILQTHGPSANSFGSVNGVMVFDAVAGSHAFTRYINLSDVIGQYEPQGIAVHDGKLYLSYFAPTACLFEVEMDLQLNMEKQCTAVCDKDGGSIEQQAEQFVQSQLQSAGKGYDISSVRITDRTKETFTAEVVVQTPYTYQPVTVMGTIVGHSYVSTVTAPTCTEQGYTTYTCACGESYVDDYVEATGHSYKNGSCTACGATASSYIQQLPENIVGCTNLYDRLVPVKGYYTATKYDTSNGAVLSVVIPVEPGDRIAASSFGSVSENMGSVSGIRVTYLLGDKIVKSLSAGEVYSGYTENGYITVPEGVDAVCVPWWAPSDSNWLTLGQISKNYAVHIPKTASAQAPTCTEKGYTEGEICEICSASLGERKEIPATGHSYSGDTCTVCGTVNFLVLLNGKYVSVLGDSISTFNGYSNDATVNTTIGGNSPRYDAGAADTKPGSYCLLESVDQTWWMHFANRSGMKLLVNNSWAGSQVFGGQTSDGRVIPAAYLDRCVNLHDNTLENNSGNAAVHPDVIFVYLGINDYNFNRSKVGAGTVEYSNLVSDDGTYAAPTTFGEAYGIMLHKMRGAYPDAQIFAMTLLPENLYSVDKTAWEQHNAYIRAAAEYYDIPVVDLAENCAITWENYSAYMVDKIHPTTAGMRLISDCIEAELAAYYKENSFHTHSYTSSVTAPTCTEQGYTTYTCACGESYVDDYVDALGHSYEDGVCTGCGKYYVNFQSATISLAGNIAINFYVELGQPILDDESAFMSFTLPDGTTKTAMLSDAEVSVKNGVTRYVFTCEVHAKQMADMVEAQMHLGTGAAVGDSRSYSVVTYAGYIIAHEDQYSAYPSLVNLLKAMLNYGAYSQIHFGYNVSNLANANLNLTLNDVTLQDVEAYRPKRAGSMTGLEITSVALILRSETVLRFYYTLSSGYNIEDYNFVVNGKAVRPIYNQDNGRYYVDVTNIAAKDLDREYGVTVTNKAGTESLSVIASAMSYVYQVIASPSYFTEDVKDVVKAMYAYNIAANAYFK